MNGGDTNARKRTMNEETKQNKRKQIKRENDRNISGYKRRGRRDNTIWKIGTWNIRSIAGKEVELQEEFEKTGLKILAITETKSKGKGIKKMSNGHIMIWSGVKVQERASAGVGCLIHKDLEDKIQNWEGHSERMMTVEVSEEKGNKWTIVIVYAPNEDEKAENKEKFWEELSNLTDSCNGVIIIMGDFNGRVGSKDEKYNTSLGKFGENKRNNNGKRILDYCLQHNLIVANTFFSHREIHTITREEPSRNEKSIIDYIMTQKENRKIIKDVKVKRGPEIGSDHYLVVAKVKALNIYDNKKEIDKGRGIAFETIRTYRLKEEKVATKYEKQINKQLKQKEDIEQKDVQQLWIEMKNIMLQAARSACGINRNNSKKKQTAWWTNEIKEQVKEKKIAWKKYLSSRSNEDYETYKRKRKTVKTMITEAKKQTWVEFGEKMERDSKGNQKLFYKVMKNMRKTKNITNVNIKDEAGNILTEEERIMTRWKEYFRKLLNGEDTQTIKNENKDKNIQQEETFNEEITKQEIEEALKTLKYGKAPGHDKITTEMIKKMGGKGITMLTKLFNKIWRKEEIPRDWEIGIIIPIYKKGDNKECKNYRGITLLSTVLKLFEQVINTRLKEMIEPTLEDAQSGFRIGRCVQDHIFTIKQIIEKKREKRKNVYLAFIDLEKAFDKVPREKLWQIMRKRKINEKMVKNIESIYKHNKSYVRTRNMNSTTFTTKEGIRQGGALSPTLFIIFMDEIIKKCRRKIKQTFVGYRNMEQIYISECAYADDIVLVSNNERELQENMNIWNEILEEYGMRINKEKTKVMAVTEEPKKINIYLEEMELEQVKQFEYLGVTIEDTGKQEIEINKRTGKAIKIYYAMNKQFINKKEITRQTKIKIFNAIYRPILTYGCETWVLNDRQKSKIQATEMKYLRRVKGVTKLDRIKNQDIRDELETESIMDFIKKRQLGWWGHLQRKDNTSTMKKIWQCKTETKRRRGRPRQKWDDEIAKILRERGTDWNTAKKLSEDRKRWRRWIEG